MKTLEQFEILEKLGSGGMGIVYKARDTRLRRIVALKLLSSELSHLPDARKRLLNEARAAAALNHPNIATIYEVGEANGRHFIAMEFIDGDQLYERARTIQIPMDLVMEWALQICEAIGAAHSQGVVHRDLKSANLMITRDGRIKVLDFGLALRQKTESGLSMESGYMAGTIQYMAPEVIQSDDATPSSDVFSIGVVLYEMLTGQLPYKGFAAPQIMYEVLNAGIPSVRDHRPDAPEALDGVIRKSMAKDAAERYPDACAMLEDLRSIELDDSAIVTGRLHVRRGSPPVSTNLPALTTNFIGRDEELAKLEERVATSRLLTITGPGGVGKTRVSIELAARVKQSFADGVYFVELAPLTEAAQVVRAIARVLSVREEPGRDLVDTLEEYLATRRVLLVLDNCEHLVDATAAAVRRLLESAPQLSVLATSQQRLDVPGEVVWRIATLSLPPKSTTGVETLKEFEAIRLFIDRAQQVKPDFVVDDDNARAVARICRHLDGIALAIELAAVRVQVLTADQILARLEDRFRLLTGGSRTSLPRQQTLQATVEWSLDLLTEPERRLFFALGAFAGGMSLEAVEHVCADDDVVDLLARLVDKSLLLMRETPSGEPRYDLLETLREYAVERLDRSEDKTATYDRHAEFYFDLARRAEAELTGREQVRWFDTLDLELDNIIAATRWLLHNGRSDQALEIGAAIWRFWSVRGYFGSGREILDKLLAASSAPTAIRATALHGAGVIANDQGDYEAARAHFEECLEIRRKLGDRSGIALTLNSLGIAARDQGDYERARQLLQEGLAINREIGDASGTAMSIHALGITAHREGKCEVARSLFEEGLGIRKSLGDRRGIGALLAHLGSVDFDLGRHDQAEPLLDEGLAIFRELENKRGIAFALMHLGGVAQRKGDLETARERHSECLSISRELGDKEHIARSIEWLARLSVAEKKYERAVELEGAATALRKVFRTPRTPIERRVLDSELKPVIDELGADRAQSARASGGRRSLDEAIELALSE